MDRQLVIGVDEAGYGPSMGPLVVACSAWLAPSDLDIACLGDALAPDFLPRPWKNGASHFPLGDSKQLYGPGGDLISLGMTLQFLLASVQHPIDVTDVVELTKFIAPQDIERMIRVPWYACEDHAVRDATVPDHLTRDNVPCCMDMVSDSMRSAAANRLSAANIEFLGCTARVLDEPFYNQQLIPFGNKSNLLSALSIELAASMVSKYAKSSQSIAIYFDRHGGRKRYLPSLLQGFGDVIRGQDWWFDTIEETSSISRYRSAVLKRPLNVQFAVSGDSLVPTAVASMLAKWTREQWMSRLNAYWRIATKRSDLRPTAGYYVDACRFADEIQSTADALNHPRLSWWRDK